VIRDINRDGVTVLLVEQNARGPLRWRIAPT
jgi:ABC-type branched-subunit amino acid transport system ATPase component